MSDQPTSRRSFLFGRSFKGNDPWLRFLARLKRSCEGKVSLVKRDSAPLARLEPARQEDVFHALSLCREYRVCMALDGLPLGGPDAQRPVLQVGAGKAWGTLMPAGEQVWRVQAGCPVQVMQAAGLAVHTWDGLPGQANLAQWIALLPVNSPPGTLGQYRIEAIEWLYPDGSIEVLGQFGVKDSQPLRSMAAQRSIPSLFQLTADPLVEQWMQAGAHTGTEPQWPLRYRLDALVARDGVEINLAHLLLGHRGSLGWVVAAHIRSPGNDESSDASGSAACERGVDSVNLVDRLPEAREIDMKIKRAMDPDMVFLSCQDQTG